MGKKRKLLELKPFCYYCDREFADEKVLLLHQRAKHFKCTQCNRKLDTATGLVVHLLQVHKESLDKVPNAKKDRENHPELVIYGMSGVPAELLIEKRRKLAEQAEGRKSKKGAHTVFGSGIFGPNSLLSGAGLHPGAKGTEAGPFGADFMAMLQMFMAHMPGLTASRVAASGVPAAAAATVPGFNQSLLDTMLGGGTTAGAPPPGMPGGAIQSGGPLSVDPISGMTNVLEGLISGGVGHSDRGQGGGGGGGSHKMHHTHFHSGGSHSYDPMGSGGVSSGGGNSNHQTGYPLLPIPSNEPTPQQIMGNTSLTNVLMSQHTQEKVVAAKPSNGVLVYDDDRISMEEKRASLARYNYRLPLIIPALSTVA